MNDQLLRTCKRLNKFTLEELEIITETDKSALKPVLEEFITSEKLIFRNELYFYNNEKTTEKAMLKLPLLFQYNTQENIELILKAFCADIPSTKTESLIGLNCNVVCKFNKFFRKSIYEKQKSELEKYFNKDPQISRSRVFFGKTMYFYFYNNRLYISEKLLRAPDSKNFKKQQIQEFKKIYSFLTRVTSHNSNETNLPHNLAEMIWRRNKSFEQLLSELKELLNA